MRIFVSLCGIKHYEHRIRTMWTIQGGNSPCQHTKNTVKPSLCIFPLFVWYIANATRWPRSGSKHVTFQHLPTNTCCMDIDLYTCIHIPYVSVLSTISRNDRYMYLHLEANTNYPAVVRSIFGSVYRSTFTLAVWLLLKVSVSVCQQWHAWPHWGVAWGEHGSRISQSSRGFMSTWEDQRIKAE